MEWALTWDPEETCRSSESSLLEDHPHPPDLWQSSALAAPFTFAKVMADKVCHFPRGDRQSHFSLSEEGWWTGRGSTQSCHV